MKVVGFIVLAVLLCISFSVPAEKPVDTFDSDDVRFQLELIAEGLEVPWGMVFLSAEQLLITEREGSVRILNIKNGNKLTIKNPPKVFAEGQGGMLDVALAPDYKTSGWLYFTYVKNVEDQGATVLARAKLASDEFTDWQDLLLSKSTTATSRHFGSRITFDQKGHVFFSIGDRGHRPNGQNLMNHAGSVLRLNLDGSVPADNPFINKKDVLPEIWSYGHRNPQGLSYDTVHNRLWEIEHGPRGGDEVNLIRAGANYGWPVISYGKEYWGPLAVGEATHKKGMEQPVKTYIPSIAPGSLMIYSGAAFPSWQGNLFSGALKLQHINRVVLNNAGEAVKEERLLENLGQRIRALVQSVEGWIYFSTDSGKIYRIRPDLSAN